MIPRRSLGRTDLKVSLLGLGSGGHSRLGTTTGRSVAESSEIVRAAVGLGINYIDTAPLYGTEGIVGSALVGLRDQVILSTKSMPYHADGSLFDASELRASFENSLRLLRTDVIDVFHLHAITAETYDYCVAEFLPTLEDLRTQGYLRYLGLTERFVADPGHRMLGRAVHDDYWDVVMVGFSILNPSARHRVLPTTRAKRTGVEVMYAVRRVLSDPEMLRGIVVRLMADGRIEPGSVDPNDPLGFLAGGGHTASVVDAAYRLARDEPGCDVVLTGTGSLSHLEANVRSIGAPPLPAADLEQLERLFGDLDDESGN